MKKLNLSVVATALMLTLVACVQREAALSPAAVNVAAQYCERNFRPWFELGHACKLEERNSKQGVSCATLVQTNQIVSKRFIESNLQKCSPARLPEMKAIRAENETLFN